MTSSVNTSRDREELAGYLMQYPHFNFYHLGDLDDFFFPRTTWYLARRRNAIDALVLLYRGLDPPVLLAIENRNHAALSALLASLQPHLPPRIYAHLSPGLETALQPRFAFENHGEHLKMVLIHPERLPVESRTPDRPLSAADLLALQRLYAAAYPGSWFDPRMLETGQYLGLDGSNGELVCVVGVHVYSERYRVAALGNIATHPEHRRRGLASALTAALCRRLLSRVDTIGLNVRSDNAPAIAVYRKLGFQQVAVYHEYTLASG